MSEIPDLSKAVGQLRVIVCGLGAVVIVVTASATLLVRKQVNDLSSVTAARQKQLEQAGERLQRLGAVANDLVAYANGRTELLALFPKHGISLQKTPAK